MKNLPTLFLTLLLLSSVYAEVRVIDKLEYRDSIAYAVGEDKVFNGTYLTKHSNGNQRLHIDYVDGLKNGLSNSWHYNGKKKSKVVYQNNKKEGVETRWHYEGQKAEETNYVLGIKNGLSTEWHENGQKYRETNFVNGKGHRTQWRRDGRKAWSGDINTNERITNWDTIKKTFTCIGEDIEFDLGMQESGNYETYWKDVTLVGGLLTIPDYGEYKRKHLYSTLWNGDYGRASFNPNTKGRLIAERKRYGKHKELQAKCK